MGETLRLFILFFGRLYVDIYRDKRHANKKLHFFFSGWLATDLTTLFYFSGDELLKIEFVTYNWIGNCTVKTPLCM